ncbi:MAG: FmdE family protein [Dethiobacteria bacterium]|jgi:formylmethanofuran dehydrogenase subunit E|nr:formylmethanofuran dehydrogenase [Bacillota bacterium]
MCREKTSWEKAVDFHGHVCPGLAIGYRVAEIALDYLHEVKAEDEEMVAIVENDACGVDAIMVMTGCTLGKGNLIFKDTGKQVYTFGSRNSQKAIRISVNGETAQRDPKTRELFQKVIDGSATSVEKKEYERLRKQRIDEILNMPVEKFAMVKEVDLHLLPGKARLFPSVKCSNCGEYAMEPRTRNQNGKVVCLDCFEDYSRVFKS